MPELLSAADVRVLGSLIEKEQTTPEYYPLSLNALMNACNQSSNRDPVVKYDEATVSRSIESLRQRGLVRATKGIDARVTKYAHRLPDVLSLGIEELVVLGVLMLRGAQTPGELRTRTARMREIDNLASMEAVLDGLVLKEYATRLPRQAGHKEARYMQVLGETVAAPVVLAEETVRRVPSTGRVGEGDRIAELEEAVEELRKECADLRSQLEAFRAQFE